MADENPQNALEGGTYELLRNRILNNSKAWRTKNKVENDVKSVVDGPKPPWIRFLESTTSYRGFGFSAGSLRTFPFPCYHGR